MVPFSFILLQTVCEGVCKSGFFLFVFVCLFLAKRLFYLLQQQTKKIKKNHNSLIMWTAKIVMFVRDFCFYNLYSFASFAVPLAKITAFVFHFSVQVHMQEKVCLLSCFLKTGYHRIFEKSFKFKVVKC